MVIKLEDKELVCTDCGKKFVFNKGEQAYYLDRAYIEPKRCADCRKIKRKERKKKRRQLIKSIRSVKVSDEVSVVDKTEEINGNVEVKDISIKQKPAR